MKLLDLIVMVYFILLLIVLPITTAIYLNYQDTNIKYVYLGVIGLTLVLGLWKLVPPTTDIEKKQSIFFIAIPVLLLYIYVLVMTILILFADMYQDEKQMILYSNVGLIVFSELFLPHNNGLLKFVQIVKNVFIDRYMNTDNFIGYIRPNAQAPDVVGFPNKNKKIPSTLKASLFPKIKWTY